MCYLTGEEVRNLSICLYCMSLPMGFNFLHIQAAQLKDRKHSYSPMVPKLCIKVPHNATEFLRRLGVLEISEGHIATCIQHCVCH